jgi:transposase
MITMVDKNRILISYYREGKSKSEISRMLKLSRKTVRKYIARHEQLFGSKINDTLLEQGLSSKPAYDTTGREKTKLTKAVTKEIDRCLKANREKRHGGMHKQQMKKTDIHEWLLHEGYDIGYTTVCNYIRQKEQENREGFIKQVYTPGHTCEFDWGEVKLYLDGKLQKLNLAVFTSAYSNRRWAKLYYRQDTLAFGQSHIDYFSEVKGVHKEMVYDNMRVAIKKFVGHGEREVTDSFLELSNYYKFGYRFCNIRKGNEKGHVERSVEYVRRKSFSREVHFKDLPEANNHLQKVLEQLNANHQQLENGKSANDLFKEERPHLYAAPVAYKCFEQVHLKADKYATIILYGNRYSIPDYLVYKLISAKVFAEKIDLYYNREYLCSHPRSYGSHTWTLDINHYLATFLRKPGALPGSLALKQSGERLRNIYTKYFSGASRDFIELLQYCKGKEISIERVETALARLQSICPTDINKDKLLVMIEKSNEKIVTDKQKNRDEQSEILRQSKETLKELADIF